MSSLFLLSFSYFNSFTHDCHFLYCIFLRLILVQSHLSATIYQFFPFFSTSKWLPIFKDNFRFVLTAFWISDSLYQIPSESLSPCRHVYFSIHVNPVCFAVDKRAIISSFFSQKKIIIFTVSYIFCNIFYSDILIIVLLLLL